MVVSLADLWGTLLRLSLGRVDKYTDWLLLVCFLD